MLFPTVQFALFFPPVLAISWLLMPRQHLWKVFIVAASYAFLFVLFGNFFVLAGGGQLFFDLAAAVTGRMIGGPAKACVISSGLYGSISGSPVADVATTGPVSIPIMRRIGMPAERAGAIEAAASTGGSILPPVMGAGLVGASGRCLAEDPRALANDPGIAPGDLAVASGPRVVLLRVPAVRRRGRV